MRMRQRLWSYREESVFEGKVIVKFFKLPHAEILGNIKTDSWFPDMEAGRVSFWKGQEDPELSTHCTHLQWRR